MKPIRTTVRGKKYYSMTDAAWHSGVHSSTVSRAVKAGKANRLGINQTGKGCVPVLIDGTFHKSREEARASLGVSERTFYRRLMRGDYGPQLFRNKGHNKCKI
jgi:predicted DNA-binding protein (UPF0251 family)